MADEYQLVDDDGWLAFASADTDDFGCARAYMRRTTVRISQSNVDPERLPLPAGYSPVRSQWYYEITVGGRPHQIYFAPGMVGDARVTAVALPAESIDPEASGRRLRALADILETKGNVIHRYVWRSGKIPAAAKEYFRTWAMHVKNGGDPDEARLWDELYGKGDARRTMVNKLYDAAVTYGVEKDPKPIRAGDIFMLFGSRENRVPEVIVGDTMPADIDWCNPDVWSSWRG